MAIRAGLVRRFLSTSIFSSEFKLPAAATAASADKPEPSPSPTIFVSGLNKRTTSEKLREAFSKFGDVINAKVVTDRVSGYSKGFGFVTFANLEEAIEGKKEMDAKFIDGWVVFTEYARPKPTPGQSGQSAVRDTFPFNRR
ncbi:organelle RRM domain-containing protein 2, mitochondrial-like [Malania oleifera]|uniref:organelle RRM domain-containing protein 2, mitochondrial-like n=1 Tax=Malania oleifera TaxID=397392 RepID=UPI0025ADAEE1|nr:organelle RRM domain-containing protein 2, mitochondrial-like [Malania oleifera]